MKKIKIKDILILQLVFMIYSICSVISKFASGHEVFSFEFIGLYGLEVCILGVYALLWQQVIKKFQLSVAYTNKAMTLLWGLVWGAVIFKEQITIPKILGVVLVIVGILVLNSGKKEEADV